MTMPTQRNSVLERVNKEQGDEFRKAVDAARDVLNALGSRAPASAASEVSTKEGTK